MVVASCLPTLWHGVLGTLGSIAPELGHSLRNVREPQRYFAVRPSCCASTNGHHPSRVAELQALHELGETAPPTDLLRRAREIVLLTDEWIVWRAVIGRCSARAVRLIRPEHVRIA